MFDKNFMNKLSKTDLCEIIDNLPWAVAIHDPTMKVSMVNKKLCEDVHVKPEEWIGKDEEELVKEGLVDRMICRQAKALQDDVYEIIHSQAGTEAVVISRPIFNQKNKIKYFIVSSAVVKNIEEIKVAIENQQKQNESYKRELEYLKNFLLLNKDDIFESPGMKFVLETLKKISHLDCTVFITGESGVGKEVIAKIIHNNSMRKDGPFIPVNISAIPDTLLESELFGYKEGAFTGAHKEGKEGLFEMAKGGTLFLDEVGDIPMNMQVKLLRALDAGEILKLGDTRTQKLDVRIIAATNRDIPSEIKHGNFREDLYYRLNVVPIQIKPLRERPEDIYPLCSHFIDRINLKYGMKKKFSAHIPEKFKTYHWPGNVRELRNVVERLALLSPQDEISFCDVEMLFTPSHSTGNLSSFLHQQDASINDQTSARPRSTALHKYKAYEEERILSALKQTNGNLSKAAKLLGMHRSKLYRKLQK